MDYSDKTKEELIIEIAKLQKLLDFSNGPDCNQQYYKSLYEFNPLMYFTIDSGLNVISVNKLVANQLGYEISELIGQPVLNVYHPDDKENVKAQLVKCIEKPYETRNLEFRMIKKSGEIIQVKENVTALVDDHQNITVCIFCEDITGKRDSKEVINENLLQLSKKNKYESIIRLVTQSVHESLNLQDVLENAADAMIKRIENVEMFTIYMVEGRNAVLKCQRGLPEWFINEVGKIKFPNGFTWKTIIEGKMSYISDATEDEAIGAAGIKLGTKSYASMPIKYKDRTIGAININSLKKDAFNEEEINVLENIAYQIQSAINNARQAEALRVSQNILKRKNEQLAKKSKYESIINDIAQSVHRSISLIDVLENAVDAVISKLNIIEHISIFLVEGQEAVLKAHRGHPDWFVERIKRIPSPMGLTWKTIIDKKPLYCPDVDKDELMGPAGKEVGAKSYASMPLFLSNSVVGCITIHSLVKNAFDVDDLNLIEKVAKQIESAITNAKHAEALSVSEQRYRALFNKSPVGVYIFNKDLVITQCNERMGQIIGSSLDKIVGLDLKNLKNKVFVSTMAKAIEGNIVTKESFYEATTSDKKIWLSLTVRPLMDTQGNVTGGIAVAQDITDRKIAEEALKESEQQLRSITDSLPIYIAYVDSDLRYQFNNAAYENWFDVKREDLKGKKINQFLGEDYFKRIETNLKKVLSGQKVEFEESALTKDGKKQIIKVIFSPDFDKELKVKGFHVLITDITESKKQEEELLRAQKIESLGILAGGIAHDFNNLLTGILGNISLVKVNMESDNKNFKRLTEAEKVSFRAKDLTQQLLTFSKGGAPVKKIVSSLEVQIKEIANFAISGSNVRCEFDFDKDLNAVEIDEGQISQVVNNVIINAQQSMPDGGTILIKACNVNLKSNFQLPLKEGDYVLIEILDQGVGISDEHLQKIFDPYFSTKQRGSGLGLTTAYSILKNHDGYIDVESKLGLGTKFKIYIPATKKEISESFEVTNEKVHFGTGKILVMDDEEIVRDVLNDMLSNLGYSVEFAENGYQAHEMYKRAYNSNKPFDLVIMDLTIPGSLGGKDTLMILKEFDSNINAVVSSGYSNDPVIANYREYGFKGIISKPYKVDELSRVIRSIFYQ
ncbi:MAG: PAS domain S-box protein [Candidatus Dadabacteria bacterium]|nr:PAS domain S-box protein [Candidatus Dadabacteria bacterium]NIQ15463.1 PAS domain S-box protein [Candidatus Dadabacteria bacterium]